MVNQKFALIPRTAFIFLVSSIAFNTVLTKEVKAVNLGTGDNNVTVLFTGFGEYYSSGLNTVNQDLQTKLGANPNIQLSSRIFADYDLQSAIQYINSFSDIKNISIVGDGYGGSSAYNLATQLPGVVNLLIEINGIPKPSIDQPINLTQFTNILRGGGFTDAGVGGIDKQVNQIFASRQSIDFAEGEQQFLALAYNDPIDSINVSKTQDVIVSQLPVTDLSIPPTNIAEGINYFYTTASPGLEPQGIKYINNFTNIDVNQLTGNNNLFDISQVPIVQQGIKSNITNLVEPVPEPSFTLNAFLSIVLATNFLMKSKWKKATNLS